MSGECRAHVEIEHGPSPGQIRKLLLHWVDHRSAHTEILVDDFKGITSTDRAKAYLVLEPNKRQACWFHLSRNFQSKVERGGQAAVIADLASDADDPGLKQHTVEFPQLGHPTDEAVRTCLSGRVKIGARERSRRAEGAGFDLL